MYVCTAAQTVPCCDAVSGYVEVGARDGFCSADLLACDVQRFFFIIIILKDKADISQLSVQTAARVFWEQLPLL